MFVRESTQTEERAQTLECRVAEGTFREPLQHTFDVEWLVCRQTRDRPLDDPLRERLECRRLDQIEALRRFLRTRDAHGLYAQFGFNPLTDADEMMVRNGTLPGFG